MKNFEFKPAVLRLEIDFVSKGMIKHKQQIWCWLIGFSFFV